MEDKSKRRISLEELRQAAATCALKGTDLRGELLKLGFIPKAVDELLARRYGSHEPDDGSDG